MRKIPTLFARDWDGDRRYVRPEVTPGCEWVINGEGIPTRKYDGTCVMFDGDRWWARREVKAGKPAPPDYIELSRDEQTGKAIGWEPVEQAAFARWHAEAAGQAAGEWPQGTYELLGPKVNGNPEGMESHTLVRHASARELAAGTPRDFDGLAAWLHAHPYEGIVWHHPDGRRAKIKKRDFPRPSGPAGHGGGPGGPAGQR